MPLVELIPALQTSSEVLKRAQAFARACGKEITTSKDVPGFVSNRLLMPFINEAVMTLEKEIATKEDIDKTLRLGMNHPMGPLTLADFIGLDTCLSIMETMYRETSDSKYRPAVLLGRMVDAGWYGKKSGKVSSHVPALRSPRCTLLTRLARTLVHGRIRVSTTIPPNRSSISHSVYVQAFQLQTRVQLVGEHTREREISTCRTQCKSTGSAVSRSR